jgi:hypothetical protein
VAAGSHPFCEELKTAKLPMIILGRDAVSRADGAAIVQTVKTISANYGVINPANGWNGLNILHRSQGEINAL